MRYSGILAISILLALTGATVAQTANKSLSSPTGATAPSGDPKSGSSSSTSGGKDANGNQGRDAMPDSNINVKPLDQQNRNQNGSPK